MIFIVSLVLMFTLFVNLYSKSKKITFLKIGFYLLTVILILCF